MAVAAAVPADTYLLPVVHSCREDEIRKTTAAPLSALRWTENSKRVERPLDCKVIAAYDVVLVSRTTYDCTTCVASCRAVRKTFESSPRTSGLARLSSEPFAVCHNSAGHTTAGLAAAHAQPHPLVRSVGHAGGRAEAARGVHSCLPACLLLGSDPPARFAPLTAGGASLWTSRSWLPAAFWRTRQVQSAPSGMRLPATSLWCVSACRHARLRMPHASEALSIPTCKQDHTWFATHRWLLTGTPSNAVGWGGPGRAAGLAVLLTCAACIAARS